ncbi:hypothetical protein [Paenimyroides ceti]
MSSYKEKLIKEFLISRNWNLIRSGKLFNYFKPPDYLNLPEGFELEIPIFSKEKIGFDNFIEQTINEIIPILNFEANEDDLRILFSKEHSILRYRIFDADNIDGTISFIKHIDSLDIFKKVLSQAVTFTTTSKPIFGNAKLEVESYLNQCRSLQTEKGSYVTKLEIPNIDIYSTINKIETKTINNKLFDVIEYIDQEIFNTKKIIKISENYIQDVSHILNYELFNSVKELYVKPELNNIEFQLSSTESFRKISTTMVQKRIPYFNKYLREIKKILLELIPLEATGIVKRLSSPSPLRSQKNEVIIEAEVANSKEIIKIILNSEEYIDAIEAHKNEWNIKVKGRAKLSKNMIYVKELDNFEVIKI